MYRFLYVTLGVVATTLWLTPSLPAQSDPGQSTAARSTKPTVVDGSGAVPLNRAPVNRGDELAPASLRLAIDPAELAAPPSLPRPEVASKGPAPMQLADGAPARAAQLGKGPGQLDPTLKVNRANEEIQRARGFSADEGKLTPFTFSQTGADQPNSPIGPKAR